ncbi:ATPase family gene 2 protein homolog B isoform X2 [Anabrus simplex]|uniref:ATPase family gene 2 protein homolog B isoform X2 n=1 Tax=Anabrus simplex TaxID=316456 RepID=UPI0035A307F1
MIILPLEDSLFSLQKLFLSCSLQVSLPFQHCKYAFVKISPDSECLCELVWKADLHPSYCQVDDSVITFNRTTYDGLPFKQFPKSYCSLPWTSIRAVPAVVFVKTVCVSVVVEEANTVRKWRKNISVLSQIIGNILKLCTVVDSCVVNLKSLPGTIKMGLNCIVIHHLTSSGNTSNNVGTISSATKLSVKKIFSKERFDQIQNAPTVRNVGGLGGPYSELKNIIIRQSRNKNKKELKFCHQVLLVGPSGCGKTSLVQKVSADCCAVLLTVLGSEVYSPQPGDTEENLRHLFKRASELASEGVCVLLLDEVDNLCPKQAHKESNSHIARAVAQLLDLLEQADEVHGLVIVATTSRPYALDPAIRRPGRLEKEIYIGVPSECQRREILNIVVKPLFGEDSSSGVDEICSKVASLTPGYVGADLSLLCQHVAQRRVLLKRDVHAYDMNNWLEDFMKAVATVRPSVLRGGVGIITVEPQSMQDIGGLDSVKQTLETAVTWPLLYPKAFERLGLPQPRDAMVGNRAEKERGVQERVLSAFLTEMDGIGVRLESVPSVPPENGTKEPALFNSNGVIVIAATNRPDMLDDALLRPGRFDKLLYVPPPNSRGRQDILKKLLVRTPLSPCVDLNILAESTDFFSGADLMSLCKEAALHALTEEGMDVAYVCQRHFLQALDGLLPSMNKKLLDWYENFNNSYRKFQ